jgi:hypothetical protein
MENASKTSAKRSGRVIGILLLVQLAAGLMLPFILLRADIIAYPDFLAAAAANSLQVRSAVFIAFVGAALTLSIAIAALPVLRRYSSATALGFLAVCAISCTLDVVHNASVMSMLSLSQRYLDAPAADAGLYRALGAVVASTRKWAHYTQLVAIGAWLFAFYSSLWRFRLVPRALASLGLIGVLLQFTGVTLLTFLGYSQEGRMAMPLGPIHVAVAIWLMVNGFAGDQATTGVAGRAQGAAQ